MTLRTPLKLFEIDYASLELSIARQLMEEQPKLSTDDFIARFLERFPLMRRWFDPSPTRRRRNFAMSYAELKEHMRAVQREALDDVRATQTLVTRELPRIIAIAPTCMLFPLDASTLALINNSKERTT